MRPLYIFDLDGTLALCDHRRHLLDNEDDPDRWNKFYEACDHDAPNTQVIETLRNLTKFSDIYIVSGRSMSVFAKTLKWLSKHVHSYGPVCMRPIGDSTPDDELKEKWLNALSKEDRERLVAVFDDRDKVVDMWRRNGVTCFQVALGNF